jgi:hypothetical protein
VDDEPGRPFEEVEVADLALITTFAEELGFLAIGATSRSLERSLEKLGGVAPPQAYI